MKYYQNILKLIGKTPLVKINKINPNKNVLMLAKLEKSNPAGSVKDRITVSMIEAGEVDGTLSKEKIIIEPTSGNTDFSSYNFSNTFDFNRACIIGIFLMIVLK